MDVTEALFDSWDRQCRIVTAVALRIDDTNRHAKPSLDSMTIEDHVLHICKVRRYWLTKVSPDHGAELSAKFNEELAAREHGLPTLVKLLELSTAAVRHGVQARLALGDEPVGGYAHPVHFLQHMIWHEGWHIGLIFLGLRIAGQEPPMEWEVANVWGEWRTETD